VVVLEEAGVWSISFFGVPSRMDVFDFIKIKGFGD
jgi:hypothetical protein